MARNPLFIALLRGINVGGHNKLPMAELRTLCDSLGWTDVQTYIQSGNLLFRAAGKPAALEDALQTAIAERFELDIATLVRHADEWPLLMAANPFPDASDVEPDRVMLALSRQPPRDDALERLRARAVRGERVGLSGGALWVHFPEGAGTSKITPTLLDRAAGSPVTLRNWRTVMKLAEMTRKTSA